MIEGRPMKVLVTGAHGCIGAWVLRALLHRHIDVVAYDASPDVSRLRLILNPSEFDRIQKITGSIEDSAGLKKLVREAEITHIVHLAAVLMPYCQANPVSGGIINVIGTLNLFEAARDAGRPVRVVFASSSAVWGPLDAYGEARLTENDPIQPTTHYGVFKQANEASARVFYTQDGISSIGLRPWTVYGPGRDSGLTADPTLALRAASEGRPFQIRLSGFLDLQYAEDVAETFVRCLLSDLEGAHVFNLQGTVVSVPQVIDMIDDLRPGAKSLLSFAGPQVPVAYRMDDSGLRAKIPDIPRTPLREGFQKTLECFDANRSSRAMSG
jgi:nucleoside-diphosphate-sugar epimerase